jgi:hypothetical protein
MSCNTILNTYPDNIYIVFNIVLHDIFYYAVFNLCNLCIHFCVTTSGPPQPDTSKRRKIFNFIENKENHRVPVVILGEIS